MKEIIKIFLFSLLILGLSVFAAMFIFFETDLKELGTLGRWLIIAPSIGFILFSLITRNFK